MKTFTLVLLSIAAAATAAPTAAPTSTSAASKKILKEIIQSVNHLNNTLEDKAKKMFVHRAVTREHCTHKNLCKAAMVLNATTVGLEDKDWLLPRQLVAYTKLQNIQCNLTAPDHQIQLQDLLQNIHHCAQKMFSKV